MIVDASGAPSRTISHHLLSAPRVPLLGTVALWLGRHQPKPTSSHRTLPQGHSRLLPAESAKPDIERAVYWTQDRKGGRTLKNSRHGAVEQTPRLTGDESAGMEALLVAHERRERANQNSSDNEQGLGGEKEKQGAQQDIGRPTDRPVVHTIHRGWRTHGRVPPANQPPIGRMSLPNP